MNKNCLLSFLLISIAGVFFVGCPRYAYLDFYNNTGIKVTVHADGYEYPIEPGQ